MHMYTRWIWYVLLLAFTGCATYEHRPLSPAAALHDFEARTLDAKLLTVYIRESLDRTPSRPTTWGLSELTLAAFFYNPRLDVARAQWAVARGHEKTAAERPNPTLGLTPGFNSTTGYNVDISPWIVGTVLDIPIETAGKRGYRVAEAHHLSQAARLHIAQAAWEVRHRVRQALLALYGANQTEELINSRFELYVDNVELLERLFEIGEVSANELGSVHVLRAETNYRASIGQIKAAQTVVTQLAQTAGRVIKMYEAGELTRSDIIAAELEFNAGSIRLSEARIEALRALGQMEDAMHTATDLPDEVVQTTMVQQRDHDRE